MALTGLVVGLGLRSPSLIGLGLGLGLRSPTRIGLWFGLGLRSPTRNRTLDFGPENRTLVKSAAGGSDFCFGLGLRALPWLPAIKTACKTEHSITTNALRSRALN